MNSLNNEENKNLMILKIERENVRIKLENQISSIRNVLNNLDSKLKSDEQLYISDGLQGSGSNIDKDLAQLATYDRAIELFNRELTKD